MHALSWLEGHRFQSATRREYDWVFAFDQDTELMTYRLWRVLEAGRIRCTREDDGQQFGLPAPIDAQEVVNRSLAGAIIAGVELGEYTHDLTVRFESDLSLQLIADSSGYEAWTASSPHAEIHAVAGGPLAFMPGRKRDGSSGADSPD